jgi:hypothetical protein
LLLAHTGENYWFGSGVSGNSSTTPNAAANQITGDIDIICKANISTNVGTNTFAMIGKYAIGSETYAMWATNNKLRFYGRTGATIIDQSSTSNINTFYGTDKWYRVTRSASTGVISFFVGDDGTNWTLLNSVTSTSGNLQNFNLNLFVGLDQTAFFTNSGRIFRATISNSIGGTPVVDFNPASYNPSVSQSSWVSATSETWTINTSLGTGTGYRGLLVDRSYVMSDGIDDAMVNTFTLATIKTIYNTYKIWDVTATGSLFASNNGAEVVDANLTGTGNCLQYDNAVNQITISLTGTLGTSNSTSMKIFQERNGSFKSKMVFSGMFLSLSADNTTIRTAIYNYIRSINGNSF